ncbi:MAG TPA: radical SAM/SPASM domain-containing protein [Chloroflexota bacterium]|nr:radical SAM/SPASM domain-containing protein [Chloroflexota bacterium]
MSAVPLASPVEAYFEVANRCNSKCATCPLTFDPQERAHNLTFEEFVKLVEQLPHLKRAVMHGIGEPLLNRDLPSMVRHLKQRDVYVLFNSNAALLTDARQRALIDCGLDEFRVSIDGSTPETYIKVRGIAAFELVIANVAAMVHLKRELGVTNPRISFWVTGMRENLPELPGVIELAARIGVDEVYLQRMVFSNIGLAVEEQSIFRGYREEAERIIAEAETLAERLGVTFRGSGAVSPRESIVDRAEDPEPWRGCSRPLRLAYITANGNALPCCIAPFTGVPYGDIVLGNYIEDGVPATWAGERYQQFRDRLYSSEPNDACRNCGVGWSL